MDPMVGVGSIPIFDRDSEDRECLRIVAKSKIWQGDRNERGAEVGDGDGFSLFI